MHGSCTAQYGQGKAPGCPRGRGRSKKGGRGPAAVLWGHECSRHTRQGKASQAVGTAWAKVQKPERTRCVGGNDKLLRGRGGSPPSGRSPGLAFGQVSSPRFCPFQNLLRRLSDQLHSFPSKLCRCELAAKWGPRENPEDEHSSHKAGPWGPPAAGVICPGVWGRQVALGSGWDQCGVGVTLLPARPVQVATLPGANCGPKGHCQAVLLCEGRCAGP